MSSWYTPTTTYHSTYTLMFLTTKWMPLIIQQKWPVAYWSCKLTVTHQNCHILEKEFLTLFTAMIVEEFCSRLLGDELFIYTEHTVSKLVTILLCGSCTPWHLGLHPTVFDSMAVNKSVLLIVMNLKNAVNLPMITNMSNGLIGPAKLIP